MKIVRERRTRGFRYKPEPNVKPAPDGRCCTVYFVTAAGIPDYPIKIGLTYESLEKRLQALQTGCPYKLTVLATISATRSYEWIVHKELNAHRLQGEWFMRSPEVMAEVEKAKRSAAKQEEQRRLNQMAWEGLPEEVRQKVLAEKGLKEIRF